MFDIFAGFDILGVGTLVGAILFFSGLIRVLMDNRSFEQVNRKHAEQKDERRAPSDPDRGAPGSTPRTRRAA